MDSEVRRPDSEDVTIDRTGKYVVAKDPETGVASQGETKAEALENLAEALRLHDRPVPEDDEDQEPSDAPWFDG